jgi:hypothetical protein
VKLRAIAIEFDFVDPFVTGWWLRMKRRQRWLDEFGKGAASNPLQPPRDLKGSGLQRILAPRFRNGTLHTLTNT